MNKIIKITLKLFIFSLLILIFLFFLNKWNNNINQINNQSSHEDYFNDIKYVYDGLTTNKYAKVDNIKLMDFIFNNYNIVGEHKPLFISYIKYRCIDDNTIYTNDNTPIFLEELKKENIKEDLINYNNICNKAIEEIGILSKDFINSIDNIKNDNSLSEYEKVSRLGIKSRKISNRIDEITKNVDNQLIDFLDKVLFG